MSATLVSLCVSTTGLPWQLATNPTEIWRTVASIDLEFVEAQVVEFVEAQVVESSKQTTAADREEVDASELSPCFDL